MQTYGNGSNSGNGSGSGSGNASVYENAVLTLTDRATPDPFVVRAFGLFYMTFTVGDHVEIWRADSLWGFGEGRGKEVFDIWHPPPNQPYSADIWAPELHSLHSRWYIYLACADPARGNPSHRTYVLGGPPSTQDPCSTPYTLLGPLANMPDRWAIDATILPNLSGSGADYMAWSSWPPNDFSDRKQQIWLTRLLDPVTAAPGEEICISTPDRPWEFSDGDHGVNEGPQFLEECPGEGRGWKGLVYSCAGSWTNEYKMALLQFRGGEVLDPRNWVKGAFPLVQTRGGMGSMGPWGPGHGSFVELGGGGGRGGGGVDGGGGVAGGQNREVVCIFHATDNATDGWENRRARVQRVGFDANGPYMGWYVGNLVRDVQAFVVGGGVGLGGQFGGGQYGPGQGGQPPPPPPPGQPGPPQSEKKRHGLHRWVHDALHGEL